MRRYASGTLPDIYQEPEFSEDMPDLRGMDIVQLNELKLDAQNDLREIRLELKNRKKDVILEGPDFSDNEPDRGDSGGE